MVTVREGHRHQPIKATLMIDLTIVYHLISCFVFFFFELDSSSMRIFLGSVTFFCLVGAKKFCYLQRLFYRTILFTKYVVLPDIHFYIQKQATTPSFYTHVRQVFNNCRMVIAYKLEVGFYITCLINEFEF